MKAPVNRQQPSVIYPVTNLPRSTSKHHRGGPRWCYPPPPPLYCENNPEVPKCDGNKILRCSDTGGEVIEGKVGRGS